MFYILLTLKVNWIFLFAPKIVFIQAGLEAGVWLERKLQIFCEPDDFRDKGKLHKKV